MDSITLTLAFLYGSIPAIIWLIFWMFQDRKNPEPFSLIARAFIAGMLAVLLSISLSIQVQEYFSTELLQTTLLAFIEEATKYIVALALILKGKEFDEPIDALIYMICVALGFAALENALFVLEFLLKAEGIKALELANLRFMGATLIHLVSSASIGVLLAFNFYKGALQRSAAGILGVIIATCLHTLFNFFIINAPMGIFSIAFICTWLLILLLILITERIKRIGKRSTLEF